MEKVMESHGMSESQKRTNHVIKVCDRQFYQDDDLFYVTIAKTAAKIIIWT